MTIFFLVQNPLTAKLQKANMMVLSKEMSDKDRSLKTQLLVAENDGKDLLSAEKVWKNNGFFGDIKPEMNLEKVNMPENTLIYVNQAYLSTVKSGDIAMYNHNFILGQLITAANQPTDIENYVCKDNEVKLFCCIYDLATGEFKGIREQVAYIVLRGDQHEIFFSYGFDKSKSQILYSYSKNQIPDAFVSTAFRRHYSEVVNEKKGKEDSSSLFFFLPSITDRKEEINQWKNNPSLTPIDFTIEFIQKFSSKKAKFEPHLLNSLDEKEREPQVEMMYGLFKHIAQYSNQNLSRNVTYLNSKLKKNINEMEWSIGSSNSKFDSKKFKLTY